MLLFKSEILYSVIFFYNKLYRYTDLIIIQNICTLILHNTSHYMIYNIIIGNDCNKHNNNIYMPI